MTFARNGSDEQRGTYAPRQAVPAERDLLVPVVLTREALEIATEHVEYRRREGWTPGQIVRDLGIADDPTWPQCLRLVAEHWQDVVAPASRAVDAERRMRMVRRRMGR
jgi:hypothetical protein